MLRTIYNYDSTLYKDGYANTYVRYSETPTNLPLNLFRLGLVARWMRPGDQLLDFGCCIGEFIRFAERYFQCTGFEPNKAAATIARRRVTSSILTTLNPIGLRFHSITLFDVLEHIQEPAELLETLWKCVVPNGTIVITTPNLNAVPTWTHLESGVWKHFKPTEHLFLYTAAGLELMLAKAGFEIAHVGYEESDIRPDNPNSDILTIVGRRRM